jgi:uncharacterized membrane protein (DUF106 family)
MPRLLIVDDAEPGVELTGPYPTDEELVRAGRQALEARAVATLFRSIREGLERQRELVNQAAKVMASLVVLLVIGWTWQRAEVESMRHQGEASALAWWAAQPPDSR